MKKFLSSLILISIVLNFEFRLIYKYLKRNYFLISINILGNKEYKKNKE